MLLMISMHLERVTWATIKLGDHQFESEVGLLQRELNGAQFLLSSCRIRRMFMAKMNIKVRTWRC